MALAAVLPWQSKGGVTHASMGEIRATARRLLSTEAYLGALEKSLADRTCPPAVEVMLHHYAYGKPAETLNVNMNDEDLSSMSVSQLMDRMKELQASLQEAQAIENAILTTAAPIP